MGTKADTSTTYSKNDVDTKISNIVNGAPAALDTLKELSDALGADANYSATIVTSLGKKQDKFIQGEIPANTVRLFDGDSTKFRSIHGGSHINVDTTSDAYMTIALNSDSLTLNNTTFTGSVTGLTKSTVGLSNVDNTTDASKPISSATQDALNKKQDQFLLGTLPPSNAARLFDSGSAKFRGIYCQTPFKRLNQSRRTRILNSQC